MQLQYDAVASYPFHVKRDWERKKKKKKKEAIDTPMTPETSQTRWHYDSVASLAERLASKLTKWWERGREKERDYRDDFSALGNRIRHESFSPP